MFGIGDELIEAEKKIKELREEIEKRDSQIHALGTQVAFEKHRADLAAKDAVVVPREAPDEEPPPMKRAEVSAERTLAALERRPGLLRDVVELAVAAGAIKVALPWGNGQGGRPANIRRHGIASPDEGVVSTVAEVVFDETQSRWRVAIFPRNLGEIGPVEWAGSVLEGKNRADEMLRDAGWVLL